MANKLLEIALTIARERLRPGYGEGFRGAPLGGELPTVGLPAEERGGSSGTTSTPSGGDVGGAGGV